MSLATEIAGKLNYLNTQDMVAVNALMPYSGYTQVSKKLDNFVFQTSSSFLNKVADKNRYIKFGEKVVDTYGPELVTNGDFSNGTTGWSGIDGQPWYIDNGVLKRVIISDSQEVKQAITTNKVSIITVSVKNHNNNGHIIFRVNEGVNDIIITSNTSVSTTKASDKAFINNGILTIIIASPISSIGFRSYSPTAYCEFDNISVREIQTAQFTVPDVTEIITNGSNTTSVSVNAGDYVVDGSELVTNGTFDSDTSGWTPYGAILSVVDGKLHIDDNGTATSAYQIVATTVGVEYTLKFDAVSNTGGTFTVAIGSSAPITTSWGANVIYSASTSFGTKVHKFIATSSITYITFGAPADSTGVFDNISVKRVSDTFRAKIDAPIGTALTNTAYFEDRTQIGVTNQQLAYQAYNVLTNSYEGIKTEVLFSDVSKEDLLDNSVWMARNGFSKVSEFLYSKGSYLCLPVGIWQSLNKGAYHPVFNGFGCSEVSNIAQNSFGKWYQLYNGDSVSSQFIKSRENIIGDSGAVVDGSGKSGRPDSKFYDIEYPDQFIDVREYAKVLNHYEVDLIRADKEENGVEETTFTYESDSTIGYTASYVYIYSIGRSIGDYIYYHYNDGTNYIYGKGRLYEIVSTEHRITKDVIFTNMVQGNYYTIANVLLTKTIPALSSNTKLSIDLIGNPTNYPQIMKDRLASGVGIVGVNPLLVDDLGNSLIADNDYNVYKYSNKSISALDLIDYNGTSYNKLAIVGSYALVTTTNSSAYIDYGAMPSISNKVTINRNTNSSVVLANYASKNNPYIQTTPKAVVEVLPKVKASNSNLIYKGCMMTAQITGKIPTGS